MDAIYENSGLYTIIEMVRAGFLPMRSLIQAGQNMSSNPMNVLSHSQIGRSVSATCELIERITRNYEKPRFGIHSTIMNGTTVLVEQETVLQKSFCDLVHFRKDIAEKQPVLLIVAPMSGHHATLLRSTVQDTLPFFDVYITDWVNARDIPLSLGSFDCDDFIDYVIDFTRHIGPGSSVMAVCQPTVPVLAAVSIMADAGDPATPINMILIGGPVDARISPTEVDSFAAHRQINWFEKHMITRVPLNYPGAMRAVYPGFIQLTGFMAMNLKRHIGEHLKLYQHLVQGDGESAEYHRRFYNEYLAVMDIPAEFYIQTVQWVFKDFALPSGTMISRNRPVNPNAIEKCGLLILEGELDDISGVGQTKAAIDLCTHIPKSKKHYHLQKGVGHYGIFSGSKFRQHIVPVIRDFVYANLGTKGK
jgi:poly(3-hydroxybutyrate) depolymerase